MGKCWASARRDCKGKISGEHVCEHHNSELSTLDTGAGDFQGLLQKVWDDLSRRSKAFESGKIRRLPTIRYEADGALLERWFFKTLINLAHVSPTVRTIGGSVPIDPPEWMLSVVFDAQRPHRPVGLYTAVRSSRPQTVETVFPDWNGWTMLGPEPNGFNVDAPDGSHSQVFRYRR